MIPYGLSRRVAALALIAALAVHDARAENAEPAAVVGELHEALLGVMRAGSALGFEARAQRLAEALEAIYDFPTMTRLAVGGAWSGASEEQRLRLVAAFRAMSVATYARRFASYNGESFQTIDQQELGPGDVVVRTRLDPGSGEEPVALDYRLRQDEAGWRIIDVYLTGTVSELATRRAEFASVIRDQGLDGLATALEAKASP